MSPLLTTFLSSAIGSILIPWLETVVGLKLDPTQQVTLTAGLIGGMTTGAHYVHTKYFPPKSTPSNGTTVKMLALLLLIPTIFLTGCQTLSGIFGNTTQATVATIAIEYATGKFIEAAGADKTRQLSRATDVANVAKSLEAVASGDQTTIAQLTDLAMQKVTAAKLSQADTLLAAALVQAIVAELGTKIQNGVITKDDVVIIDQVLGAVLTATKIYGAA